MGGAYTRNGLIAGGHTADQVARRDAALARIRVLLAEKPRSTFDLSADLNIPSSTIHGYLMHLEDMGEVYKMDSLDDRGRKTWALDSEVKQAAGDRALAEHAKRAWIMPARQMGMPRDPLVEALFGPAQNAAWSTSECQP